MLGYRQFSKEIDSLSVTLLLLPGLGLALPLAIPVWTLVVLNSTIRHHEHLSRLNSALDINNYSPGSHLGRHLENDPFLMVRMKETFTMVISVKNNTRFH